MIDYARAAIAPYKAEVAVHKRLLDEKIADCLQWKERAEQSEADNAKQLEWRQVGALCEEDGCSYQEANERAEKAEAALRELIEQKPVAWLHMDGKDAIPDYKKKDKVAYNIRLYAMPVAQPSEAWLDEAMRLADVMVLMRPATMPQQSDDQLMTQAIELENARAALREHLEKR
jgi:hypothetical protein